MSSINCTIQNKLLFYIHHIHNISNYSFFPNITTAFFQHTENNRKIAPEQLKSKFLTVALCIKVEHADAEPRSSSPADRQAVSLLSTELALAWTTTVSVKLSFHRIINTSYRRNSPSFSHLAPDLYWVSAPTLFPFSQVLLWVLSLVFLFSLTHSCPRFPGRDPKRPEEQRDCTSSPSRQAERGLRSF